MSFCLYCSKRCQTVRGDEGFICCTSCGRIIDSDMFSTEVTFIKNAGGQSQLSGNFVKSVENGCSESRFRSLEKGKEEISYLVEALGIAGGNSIINQAWGYYKIAFGRNFTRGRSISLVAAGCLYIACRENKKAFLLIDFSEELRVNVYVLGAVFLQLCNLLRLGEEPFIQKLVDPSLFIHRFTERLLGGKNAEVSGTALRILASMKRDWMQTGRKPSGLCGAALYISAHAYGLKCSKSDIGGVVHICEATLTKRLIEFENTESGSLTLDEFNTKADELESECSQQLTNAGTKSSGVMELLCEHKGSDSPHFAHGLCKSCYDEFVELSGGLQGGSDPPAFQRAERERMEKSSAAEKANEAHMIENSEGAFSQPNQHVNVTEKLVSQCSEGGVPRSQVVKEGVGVQSHGNEDMNSVANDEAESLSDIDDIEEVIISQYADDTLIFIDAKKEDISYVKSVFHLFSLASGLSLNFAKSIMYYINMPPTSSFHVDFGCVQGTLPAIYLGLPLGAKFRNQEFWEKIKDKLRSKLGHWKKGHISKGGRLTLINSTLATIPIHAFAILRAPTNVIKDLERIMKNFLWGDSEETRKHHPVSWELVTTPKELGGLGVTNIRHKNTAMLSRWCWRFLVEPNETYWKRLIIQKYGLNTVETWTRKEFRHHGGALWKTITQVRADFEELITWSVHTGNKTRFWDDVWICNHTASLKQQFPAAYLASRTKENTVQNAYSEAAAINGFHWNLGIRSRQPQHIQDQVVQLVALLPASLQQSNEEDVPKWRLETQLQTYTVSSYVKHMQSRTAAAHENFPHQQLWQSKAPPRVNFLMWLAAHERASTYDRVMKMGHQMANRCTLCEQSSESNAHLFIHCPLAKQCWDSFGHFFRTDWGDRTSVKSILTHKRAHHLSQRGKIWWNILPHSIIWALWKERNNRAFEDKRKTMDQIQAQIRLQLWDWTFFLPIMKDVQQLIFL